MEPQPTTSEFQTREFDPDWNDLAEVCVNRVNRIWREEYPFYLFANPLVVITARHPSSSLKQAVRAFQKRWMNQSRTVFGKAALRKPRNWVNTPCQPTQHRENILNFSGGSTKYEKFIGKSICYTGVLFYLGKVVHPNHWDSLLNVIPSIEANSDSEIERIRAMSQR